MVRQVLSYLKYRLQSKTRHRVHSPFVYDLVSEILPDSYPYYAWDKIEKIRQRLLEDERMLEVTDYGAGSRIFKSNKRKVGKIASVAVQPPEAGQLLFRLVHKLKPRSIIELGTSLGITSLYLAAPSKNTLVYTLEGCPQTLAIAREVFAEYKASNIRTSEGNFQATLPLVLHNLEQIDFVYFDGHHQEEATLNYFHACIGKAHNETVFVFDDIHWSPGMEQAWKQIKAHKKVRQTIDVWQFGLVFFRAEQAVEHFRLRIK